VKVSPLEALAVAVQLLEDPRLASRRAALEQRLRATIERYGLAPVEDHGRPFDCPFLTRGHRCAIHETSVPVGCCAYVPVASDRCHMRMDQLETAGRQVARLNDALYGRGAWPVLALPVAVERALADLRSRAPGIDRGGA
jgi:hypothetical protein